MSDPDFSKVILLLDCDGTAGSSTFTDLSSNPQTVTPHSGAIVSTTNPNSGTGCLACTTASYLSADINTSGPLDIDPGGDWTIEGWVRFDSTGFGNQVLFDYGGRSSGTGVSVSQFGGTLALDPNFGGGFGWSSVGYPSAFTAGSTYYHVAAVKHGTDAQLYVNGVGGPSPASNWIGTPSGWGAQITIGASTGFGIGVFGAMDDIRISKIARYTADFTPPAAPFPTTGPSTVPVPDVVGETLADATIDITDGDLTLGTVTYEHSDVVAVGLVISQDPASGGADVAVGTPVDLVISLGPAVIVPDVVGETLADATTDIVAATFVLGAVTSAYSDSVAVGLVISQSPIAGSEASAGDAIAVVISLGVAPAQGPPLNLDATVVTRLHVILVWDEPLINGPFEYAVYRDNLLIGTTAEDIKTFEDTNVVVGVTYRYTVAGWDSGAEENLTPLSDEEVVEIPTQLVFPPVVFAALGDAKPRIYEPKENLVVRGHE